MTDEAFRVSDFLLADFARIDDATFCEWELGGIKPHLRRSAQQADDLPTPSSKKMDLLQSEPRPRTTRAPDTL
jgi:hypothetical protein